jgi:putative flippase GtrA
MENQDSTEKYLLLRKIYQGQLFRYGIAAASGFIADQVTYLLFYYVVLSGKQFPLGTWMITPRAPSLLMSFSVGLVVNFSISKYFVFKSSYLGGRTQLFRFIHVTIIIFTLNYLMMRFLEDQLQLESGISRFVAAASISMLSFVLHRSYTFKVRNEITVK